MDDLLNIIRREAERVYASRHSKRYGIVTSYNPEKHLAKVTLQPEGQESGWLPIRTSHIGNGWGMVVGLQLRDQVELTPQEGDVESLAITGVVHSDEDKPPMAESGEIYLKHQMGASVKLGKTGSLALTDAGGGTIVMNGSGVVTING